MALDPVEEAKRRYAISGNATLADLPYLYALRGGQEGAADLPLGGSQGLPGRTGGKSPSGISESGLLGGDGGGSVAFGPGATLEAQEFQTVQDLLDRFGGDPSPGGGVDAGISDLGFLEGLSTFGPNALSMLSPLGIVNMMLGIVAQPTSLTPSFVDFLSGDESSPVAGSGIESIGRSRAAKAFGELDFFGGGDTGQGSPGAASPSGGGGGPGTSGGPGTAGSDVGGSVGGPGGDAGSGGSSGGGPSGGDTEGSSFHEGGFVSEDLNPAQQAGDVEATIQEGEYVIPRDAVEILTPQFLDGLLIGVNRLRDL